MAAGKVAMIPARMGSQRLKFKNLREIDGVPLIVHAIRKAQVAGVFDEIWVNSEDEAFREYAEREGAKFHHRPKELGNDNATHEQYIREFLTAHPCGHIFQVHSIAPLLTAVEVRDFVKYMTEGDYDMVVSVVLEQIECCMNDRPVNFTFERKQNSQELDPIQRVTWSLTGWKADSFMRAADEGRCATYAGRIGFYPVNRNAGHIIKTEADLNIAQALFEFSRPY